MARGADQVMSTADADLLRILGLPVIPLDVARCPNRAEYARGFYNHAKPADFVLRDIQIDAAYTYETYGGLVAPLGVGHGKCCCASSNYLDLASGERRSVADPGAVRVNAYHEQRGCLVEAEATAFESGSKPCVRVQTSSGKWVELSTDHPILTPGGWTHAAELKEGSLVAVPEYIPVQTKMCVWSVNQVKLLGYLIADGGLANGNCTFVDDNLAVLGRVESLVTEQGGASTRKKEKSKAFRLNITGLRPLVREWGIDTRSKEKKVPAWVWGMPDEHVWSFLGALLTCDGHLRCDHNVEYCTASEDLMRDVTFLLQRVGVHGRSLFKMAKCGAKRFPAWVMVVSGIDCLRLLLGTGPWVGQEEKWKKLVGHHCQVKHNTNVDIVPIGREELKEICDELGYQKVGGSRSQEHGRPRSDLREKISATTGQYIGRLAFAAWVAESGYSGKYAWLGTAPLRWDKVVSVANIGTQKVYDLSVPGPNNFVTNGIVVHNTILSIMCAKIGLERRGHYRALVMVPPQVLDQLVNKDLPLMRKWLALDSLPIYLVGGSASDRMRRASQPGKAVFIYTYSSLSAQTGYDELAAMSPTLFIQDEAHLISRSTAARTKRWQSAINVIDKAIETNRMGPDVKTNRVEAVIMSGTITKKKIADYAHLARVALREQSPTPIKEQSIMLLGGAIDAEVLGDGLGNLDLQRASEVINWARQVGYDPTQKARERGLSATFQETVRDAYQHRLRTAPGVVSTSDASVDCSLYIAWSEPPRPRTPEAEKMGALMKQVVTAMTTPDGDVIDYGMHTYKWLWELSGGFYNSLVWPTIEQVQKSAHGRGKPVTEREAEMLLEAAKSHHALLQVYHKELRQFLDRNHIPGCDTPMLVALEINRQLDGTAAKHRLSNDLIKSYRDQKAARYDDLPQRIGRPVRICDYKVVAGVEWAREHIVTGGLIWVHHPELAHWLHEYLDAAGIPHTLALAGQNEAAYTHGLVIVSYAHGTGKNLQHQNHNLFLELRREASTMEQALGRTHRSGQMADDVRVDVFISSGFDLALFNAILRDADYIQATTGQAQRLCYGTYSPVIPPTDPRLAVRLGIVARWEDAQPRGVKTYDAITPPEALNWGDVFRSARFQEPKAVKAQ